MMPTNHALCHLQALLGAESTDDTTWGELRRFQIVAQPIVRTLWQLDQESLLYPWRLLRPPCDAERTILRERCMQAALEVQHVLGDETSACAAAFFFHPQLWEPGYLAHHHYPVRSVSAGLLRLVAETCIQQSPPVDLIKRICRRVMTLCLAASPGGDPHLAHCIELLLDGEDLRTTPFLDAVTAGDWNGAANTLACLAAHEQPERLAEGLRQHWGECATLTERLLQRLAATQRLDPSSFRQALLVLPNGLQTLNYSLAQQSDSEHIPDLHQQHWNTYLLRLIDTLLWELVSDLRPETWPTLSRLAFLSGGRYLLRIAEEVEQQQLAILPRAASGSTRRDSILVHLLQILQRRSDDDPEMLAKLLAHISTPALLAMLPHATAYEAEICAALDWPAAYPLLRYLRRIEAQQPSQSADPRAGVIVRSELLQMTAQIAEQPLRQLLDACAGTMRDAVLLVRAALGWNTTEIRRMFGRRNRMAARALPLLPMNGPDQVLQCYLALVRFQREAQLSSAGRKPFERAAADAALTNLAYTIGYADATRLEWAMQAQLGAERTAIGRSWAIAGYTLTLTLGDRNPVLSICNAKRVLKRMPVSVTRDYAYREVRTTLEQAQDQDRRIRQALLAAMCSASAIQPDELALLRANPIAARQLAHLVLVDAAGAHGLFCPDDGALEGTHGERVPISGAVMIAHPFTLAGQGVLSDWQSEIVRRQIVQPFKQVFRELYLVTPAELSNGGASSRLAGRRMRGRQALAVLANMGWHAEHGAVRKPFYQLGIVAELTFEYDEDSVEETLRVGTLSFWPLEQASHDRTRLSLADIPPIIFSEVLYELDCATIIAHQGMEHGSSREILQRRGDLVRAIAKALGLRQVHVDELAVLVRGCLTSYRIQLATGAVYLASGQYLCIVPKPNRPQPLYLPFAEGGDPITSEIMSKVLLLANDQAIRDESILAQIAPQRQAA